MLRNSCYTYVNKSKGVGYMNDTKEKIQPISFPLYRSTFERLVKTKDKKKMTHDELLNYLLDREAERKK